MNTPHFVRIKWNGWDYIASPIDDIEELQVWLEDGSLKEGEEVFQILVKFKVVVDSKEKLKLEEQK